MICWRPGRYKGVERAEMVAERERGYAEYHAYDQRSHCGAVLPYRLLVRHLLRPSAKHILLCLWFFRPHRPATRELSRYGEAYPSSEMNLRTDLGPAHKAQGSRLVIFSISLRGSDAINASCSNA